MGGIGNQRRFGALYLAFAAAACNAANGESPADTFGATETKTPNAESKTSTFAIDDADGGTTNTDAAIAIADAGLLETPTDAARRGGPGDACSSPADCESTCVDRVCTAPTVRDGRVSPSLGETDVDCGGATAAACADDARCAIDRDCKSRVCGADSRCVVGPSCRGRGGVSGVSTCGAGEPGAPGASLESCCTSLPLPASRPNRRLDRYEITSGRLRAFIADVAAKNGGVPNIRKFVTDYASAPENAGTELASVAASYPGLLEVLPNQASAGAPVPLPVHLGAFPMDPINLYDGCYTTTGAYGHATYWQPADDVAAFGIGVNGNRIYSRESLDAKSVNCVMPLLLAAFCAWDGGELARTEDYYAVWGRNPVAVATKTVYVPWSRLLSVSEFNWRNGVTQDTNRCTQAAIAGWPGCVDPANAFYTFPALQADGSAYNPADDASPAIAAPGRFALDVTNIKSAARGWYDIGGNLMEAAWPVGTVNPGTAQTRDVCDVSAVPGPGDTPCTRSPARGITRTGVLRYKGNLPHIALIGYSFEGHARRSEVPSGTNTYGYLGAPTPNDAQIAASDLKAVTFQYGKVGGRCARHALAE